MTPDQLSKLKKETEVFDALPEVVSRISWDVFDVVEDRIYDPRTAVDRLSAGDFFDGSSELHQYRNRFDPIEYCIAPLSFGTDEVEVNEDGEKDIHEKLIFEKMDELPREFFNHQLFDDVPIREFMERWGLLYSPLRNNPSCLNGWENLELLSEKGVEETEELLYRFPEYAGIAVSKLEAEATRSVLREAVLLMRDYIVKASRPGKRSNREYQSLLESYYKMSQVFSGGSCNNYGFIRMGYLFSQDSDGPLGLRFLGQLTSAICNQVIDALKDVDEPWRKCAREGCDVIFKVQQSNAVAPHKDSRYCCVKCADTQRKRNNRHSRTKH